MGSDGREGFPVSISRQEGQAGRRFCVRFLLFLTPGIRVVKKIKPRKQTNETNEQGKKGTEWEVEEVRREIDERKVRGTGQKVGERSEADGE